MESRNIVLAVLIVVIALGVFFMIDPTLGGLCGSNKRYEQFENEVITTNAAPSMNGMNAGTFQNAGAADALSVMNSGNVSATNMLNSAPANSNNDEMSNGAQVTEGFENLNPSPMPFAGAEKPANCYPKNQLSPSELLPNDPNSKWAQVNPMGSGDIAGKNFLNAGALIGVDTVGQSNRNASWDLRSIPANPQVQVSPWMQSTIEPDLNRRPLE